MRLSFPSALLLAGILALAPSAPLRADAGFEIDLGPQPPPPPPPEAPPTPADDVATPSYPSPGPGACWIEGHWEWQGGRWVWWPGYWDYPPSADVEWIYGGTLFIDGRYIYQRGHWGKRGEGWRRGHRIYPRDSVPPGGTPPNRLRPGEPDITPAPGVPGRGPGGAPNPNPGGGQGPGQRPGPGPGPGGGSQGPGIRPFDR